MHNRSHQLPIAAYNHNSHGMPSNWPCAATKKLLAPGSSDYCRKGLNKSGSGRGALDNSRTQGSWPTSFDMNHKKLLVISRRDYRTKIIQHHCRIPCYPTNRTTTNEQSTTWLLTLDSTFLSSFNLIWHVLKPLQSGWPSRSVRSQSPLRAIQASIAVVAGRKILVEMPRGRIPQQCPTLVVGMHRRHTDGPGEDWGSHVEPFSSIQFWSHFKTDKWLLQVYAHMDSTCIRLIRIVWSDIC